MRVTGPRGLLRRGFQAAAQFGAWTLVREADVVTVTAPVVWRDGYWMTQAPLEMRLTIGNRVWAWPDVQVTQQDGGASLTVVTQGSPLVL